jgi:hypothetical protein
MGACEHEIMAMRQTRGMSEAMIQLDYAKPTSWYRRRAFRRIFLGVGAIAVSGTAWRWGPAVWERAQLLYWERQCLNYIAPADAIVYDQVPNGRSPLLSGSSGFVADVEKDYILGSTTAAIAVADCETHFKELMFHYRPPQQPPIIFMHDRAALSGRHYLVILRGDDLSWLHIGKFPTDFNAFGVGNWRDGPWDAGGARSWDGPESKPQSEQIRIYAGQADPVDATHFTVRYVENGKEGLVDGYVDDVADPTSKLPDGSAWFNATVTLVPRKDN